ncbi:PAAR domain-containing protein [Pseudomonas sp. IT-P218]|uniref:PAAR domain-containing protein n=1 Tax=Pseudomonas sp. IT-P218 TaxID=3026449 RepID=UPI0039E08C70
MQVFIRLGDKLSSDGEVISVAEGMSFMGRGIACVGDKVRCPLPGHGENAIAEGDAGSTWQGRPMVLHGHRCDCGCTLITSLPQAGRL